MIERREPRVSTPARHRPANVALLVGDLSGGGQARVQARLADAFVSRGYRADLLYLCTAGPNPGHVSAAVNVVDLRTERSLLGLCRFVAAHPTSLRVLLWHFLVTPRLLARPYVGGSRMWMMLALSAFVRYLRNGRPTVVYAAGDRANLIAAWARRIAGVETPAVIGQHNVMSDHLRIYTNRVGKWRARLAVRLMSRAFLQADAIISVSDGVGDDMARTGRIPRQRVTTIHNPVVTPEMRALSDEPLDHPWFRPGAPPVILGAGRMTDQKDFPTLIRAFGRVRRQRPVRLVILGEGPLRGELEALVATLDVADDIALPGFVSNPFAYMSRAGVFVLSSRSEALPMVHIEALACGCPVVSTDCAPSLPEILRRPGMFVSVGDDAALAKTIVAMLNNPPAQGQLVEQGMSFTVERAARQYARFIPDELPCGSTSPRPARLGEAR